MKDYRFLRRITTTELWITTHSEHLPRKGWVINEEDNRRTNLH